MQPKVKDWLEKHDSLICKSLECVTNTDESISLEALMWCGHPGIKWDKDKLARLAPLLKEYGKIDTLIEAMRSQYKAWVL